MKEYESAAMWRLYTQAIDQAIAIRSTVKHLHDSIPVSKSPEERIRDNTFLISEVHYLDYKKETIPDDAVFNRIFYKRKSYEHEAELRALLIPEITNPHQSKKGGIYIPINLDALIDEIYVGPGTPGWFFDLVKNISTKYGIKKVLKRTALDDKVLF